MANKKKDKSVTDSGSKDDKALKSAKVKKRSVTGVTGLDEEASSKPVSNDTDST